MIASVRAATGSRLGAGLAALCASAAAAALFASPALAARGYECQITGSSLPSTSECNGVGNTVPGGAFELPNAVAIDASDNVWVADAHATETHASTEVDEFNSVGDFIRQGDGEGRLSYYTLGLAFRDASSQLYAADTGGGHVWVLNEDLSFNTDLDPSAWGRGCCFIHDAIDNSGGTYDGDLYLQREGTVTRVDGAGTAVDFTSGTAAGGNVLDGADTAGGYFSSTGLTVDSSSGDIYVLDYGHNVVDQYASSGSLIREFKGNGVPGEFGPNLTGAAVDPTNHDLLVVDTTNDLIDEFGPTGSYIGQIVGTGPSEATAFGRLDGGIAVDSSGFVYVTDETKKVVDVFTPDVTLPKVSYRAVTDQEQTSGTLNATADPNGGGNIVACHFEYGTTPSYNLGSVPCEPDPAGSPPGSNFNTATLVSAHITGLMPQTVIHYRVIVGNSNGSRKGPDQTYLPQAVAALTTDAPTQIEPASATLNGSYVGTNEDTRFFYEWGTSTSYGQVSSAPPGADAGAASGPDRTGLPYDLNGLTPETTYHYRIIASNSVGTSTGHDQHFITPPAVTALTTGAASDLAAGEATLNASFTGVGRATTFYFEYVEDQYYASKSANPYAAGLTSSSPPGADAGSGAGTQVVSAVIDIPSAGARYHYRVVAANEYGVTYGSDRVFTSAPPLLPVIGSVMASNVTDEEATFEAEVNPEFGATVVRFQYGVAPTYGSQSRPTEPIGSDNSTHPASVSIGQLEPGTEYHFRAVATNFAGTVTGPDQTFTTGGSPSIVTPPPGGSPPRPTSPPPTEGSGCERFSEAAAESGRTARKLRREAGKASTPAQARRLGKKAASAAKKASHLRSRASRCRSEGRV